jgi:hypothetical protein
MSFTIRSEDNLVIPGFLAHLHSSMVTMSQKSSVLQPAKSVSQALTPDRRESENHERVEGLEPGHRDLAVPNNEIDGAVGMLVGPQRDRVALRLRLPLRSG